MYDLSKEQFTALQQIYSIINSLTLTGGQNFSMATQVLIRLEGIISELQKQGIKVDNTSGIVKKEIVP